jgi:hypothetical protein
MIEDAKEDEYAYSGLPITWEIIEKLIIHFFNGRIVPRNEINEQILEFHLSKGGKTSEGKYRASVKKALINLTKRGQASRVKSGVWKIHKEGAPTIVEIQNEEAFEKMPKHETYGKGDFAIYLYFFPTYKQHAQLQGKNTWPCKIGKTERDARLRILTQTPTALPEKPSIEFVIKTQNSTLLETLIHSILKVHNKQMVDSRGTEWFDTNPEEVLNFIRAVKADIL